MLHHLKMLIIQFAERLLLIAYAFRTGSKIGLPLHVNKIKYIKLGNKVKIHSGFRIECFDSFSNRKYSPEFKLKME